MNNKIKILVLLWASVLLFSSCTVPQPEDNVDIKKEDTKKEISKQKDNKDEVSKKKEEIKEKNLSPALSFTPEHTLLDKSNSPDKKDREQEDKIKETIKKTSEEEIIKQKELEKRNQAIVKDIKNLKLTFSEDDITKFKKELKELDKKILDQEDWITFDQVVQKARYLDYIWNQRDSIKLYLNHSEKYSTSIIFKHNLWDLYERVWEYDRAITEYEFIVKNKRDYKYLENLIRLYEKVWNKDKLAKTKLLKTKLEKK